MTEIGANSSFHQVGTQHIFLSGSRQSFLVIFPTVVVFRTVGALMEFINIAVREYSLPALV